MIDTRNIENTTQYFLQIEKNPNGAYQGCIHQGNRHEAVDLGNLQLKPDNQVTIKGQSYSLAQLVKALIQYDENDLKRAFDERGQLEIGQYLFAETFGKLESSRKGLQPKTGHVLDFNQKQKHAETEYVLDFNQKQKLVKRLLECPSIRDVKSRSTILKELPPHIADAIKVGDSNKEHVLNIVNTCMNYAEGLDPLLKALRFFDENTIPFQSLTAFIDQNLLNAGAGSMTEIVPLEAESPRKYKILPHDKIEVRVLCHDEHIASLPWVLLSDKGVFLSAANWSVALADAQTTERDNVELPPFPKILIIAPQPNDVADTEAAAHFNELQNEVFSWPEIVKKRLQIASTWEEFKTLAKSLQPEIVYYYGHGKGDENASYLLFADQTQQLCETTVADFAQVLRNLQKTPQLAYINCCQGNTGGWLGVGQQLGNFIPAVITNRTVAQIAAARAQALAFWRGLLIEGLTPHKAVASMRSRLVDDGMGFSDARWMTPVFYCHYCNWKTKLPTSEKPLGLDGYWRLQLDRLKQFSEVWYRVARMIERRRPASITYIWYGQSGQGVELFHERLEFELRNELSNKDITPEIRKPAWPDDFAVPYISFKDMYCECFEVGSIEDIPLRLQKTSNPYTLLYICHEPIQSSRIDEKCLKDYLEWWDEQVIYHLKNSQIFGLLGISFVVDDPSAFYDKFSSLNSLDFEDTSLKFLDEMGNITEKELLEFLDDIVPNLKSRRKRLLARKIIQKTKGHYEETLEEIKARADRGWYVG